jgi:hypothetical protein
MTAGIINRTMDRSDFLSAGATALVDELDALIRRLRARNLKIRSWYGVFDVAGGARFREKLV